MIIDYEFGGMDDFKIKVGTVSSSKLCEIIASYRYLAIMQDEAVVCMIELSRRREFGDDFNYENYIIEMINSFPKFKEITDPLKVSRIF